MPSQYSSEKKTIGELLSMTSPTIEVPEWQRNYSWDPSHVETFWQDLLSFSNQYPANNINEQEYFLGSIVSVSSSNYQLLLDGQQRIATATILLSVIRDQLGLYDKNAATRTSQKYITDFDDASGCNSFKLTLNKYDRDFFRQEIQEYPITSATPTPEMGSHKLIRRARDFFKQRFQEKYDEIGGGKPSYDWTLRIQKVLCNHTSIVVVASEDEDNAAMVFETLNDRGIGLSTPDLLRNLLLRRANEGDREEIVDAWRSVLEIEEDGKVDNFLRHYWLSYNGDVKSRSLYREIKKRIIEDNIDSLAFTRQLRQAANVYRDLIAARDDDPDLRRSLENINTLGALALMPAILSAYAENDLEGKRSFLSALTTLYVRYNVIGNLENNKLENVAYSIAKQLRVDHDFKSAIGNMIALAPSDGAFVDRFKTAQLTKQASARYILREIEHTKRATKEVKVETPDRVHVEHIYPQTPLPGQRWDNHEAAVYRLGNLTLLSSKINQSIKNSDFLTKRGEYEKSDIVLTQNLLKYDKWDMETISEVQNNMSTYALAIWSFPI